VFNPRPIATALVRSAGLGQTVTHMTLWGHSTNQVWLVEVDRGAAEAALALHDRAGDEYDRCAKERFLHNLVRRPGIPAPRVLATDDQGLFSVRLLERLPGVRADDALRDGPPEERAQIWRVVGATMRRIHQVRLPGWVAGEIVGDRVVPFVGTSADSNVNTLTWGHYILDDLPQELASLAQELGLPAVDTHRVTPMVDVARRHLDALVPVLMHNDPRLANILVDRRDGRWQCTGWLDWEFARVGEPSFDLARLDLARSPSEPAVPAAFWAGYGDPPDPLNLAVSRLAVALWFGRAGGCSDEPDRYAPARTYLKELHRHLDDLEQLCAGARQNLPVG